MTGGAFTHLNDGGGAVVAGGSATVSGATFTDITSRADGAAVNAGKAATVTSSAFTLALSSLSGGAVYANTMVTVADSRFTSCYAASRGGAVASNLQANVTRSIFQNTTSGSDVRVLVRPLVLVQLSCTVESLWMHESEFCLLTRVFSLGCAQGGAIHAAGAGLLVSASSFTTSTSAAGSGGALASTGSISVLGGCSFTSVYAPAGEGGAVWAGSSAVSVSSAVFSTISASGRGGAVYGATSATVSASNFTEVSSGKEVRAVTDLQHVFECLRYRTLRLVLLRCKQLNACLSLFLLQGGAVFALQSVAVDSTGFVRTTAGSDGGAVCGGSGVTIRGSSFTTVKTSAEGGGAVACRAAVRGCCLRDD